MTANWTPTLGKASRLAAKATEERDRLILLAHEDGVPTEEIAGMCGMERADVERITGVESKQSTPVKMRPEDLAGRPTVHDNVMTPIDKPGRRPPKSQGGPA